MEKYLPKEVIYRSKTGFGAPVRAWVTNGMSEKIKMILSKDNIQKRGIFDYKAVSQLIDHNERGRLDASYTVLSLFCIEIWCQTFIDQEVPKPIELWK